VHRLAIFTGFLTWSAYSQTPRWECPAGEPAHREENPFPLRTVHGEVGDFAAAQKRAPAILPAHLENEAQ
jgi:hypothetical protein